VQVQVQVQGVQAARDPVRVMVRNFAVEVPKSVAEEMPEPAPSVVSLSEEHSLHGGKG